MVEAPQDTAVTGGLRDWLVGEAREGGGLYPLRAGEEPLGAVTPGIEVRAGQVHGSSSGEEVKRIMGIGPRGLARLAAWAVSARDSHGDSAVPAEPGAEALAERGDGLVVEYLAVMRVLDHGPQLDFGFPMTARNMVGCHPRRAGQCLVHGRLWPEAEADGQCRRA